jgi:hypothetical protein
MSKTIIHYAKEGNIDGVKGQLEADVNINWKDGVSY